MINILYSEGIGYLLHNIKVIIITFITPFVVRNGNTWYNKNKEKANVVPATFAISLGTLNGLTLTFVRVFLYAFGNG